MVSVLLAIPTTTQSQNFQARSWFKIGAGEKDPQKKIEAYTRAVEADSVFVEALYNLGMLYNRQQDYTKAEQFLLRAYKTQPERTKYELKLQILFELANLYKKLGRFKDCEDALRGAKALAVDPTMRATLSFELGRLLYLRNRHEEALAELREGQKLSTNNKEYFTNFIQLAEIAIESQRLYDAAIKTEAGGNLKQAKTLLEEIKLNNPGFKDVEEKIARLDSTLNSEARKDVLADTIYERAQRYMAEGNLEMAIAMYENLLQQAGSYKDAGAKLQQAREQLAQKRINEQLENEYTAGMAALRVNDWSRAILAFEKVLALNSDFRDTRKRLAEAESGLNRESRETIVARYYADGVSAMNENDLGKALAALEKAHKLSPNYRDVASLLAEVESTLRKKTEPSLTLVVPAVAPTHLDSLYQAAVAFEEKKDWAEALATWEKIQTLEPNYRDVLDRLAMTKMNLDRMTESTGYSAQTNRTALYIGSALVALVVLPLAGVIVLSPTTRARIHLLRGNYTAAAQIYEKILSHSPGRVKLYPILANIYLLLGRSDEHAMKIYKMILQLNIATHKRDEINSIVAQKYLTEGRTDSDAIEVLENALKVERQKQQFVNY